MGGLRGWGDDPAEKRRNKSPGSGTERKSPRRSGGARDGLDGDRVKSSHRRRDCQRSRSRDEKPSGKAKLDSALDSTLEPENGQRRRPKEPETDRSRRSREPEKGRQRRSPETNRDRRCRERSRSKRRRSREPQNVRRHGGGGRQRARSPAKPPTSWIRVDNLPEVAEANHVQHLFSSNDCKVLACLLRSGSAFVHFERVASAVQAVKQFDGGEMNGLLIAVQLEHSPPQPSPDRWGADDEEPDGDDCKPERKEKKAKKEKKESTSDSEDEKKKAKKDKKEKKAKKG